MDVVQRYMAQMDKDGNYGLYDVKRGIQEKVAIFWAHDAQLATDVATMLNNRDAFRIRLRTKAMS